MFSLFFTLASSLIWTHLPFAGMTEMTASSTRAGKTFLLPSFILLSNEHLMSMYFWLGGLVWFLGDCFGVFVCLFVYSFVFFFSHKTWGRASVRRLCFSRSDPSYCPASESLTVKCTSSFGSQLPISLTLCCAMSLILFSIVFLVLRLFYYLKLN